jgi:undecaprenyl-diphosphatase
LTEFIPVSSTGHLLIAEHWLKLDEASFFRSDLFNVVVQCGAVLAVLPLFTGRMAMLARWRESAESGVAREDRGGVRGHGAVGVVLEKRATNSRGMWRMSLALLIGGVLFIVAEMWCGKAGATRGGHVALARRDRDRAARRHDFSCASRSGSTIIFSLLCGTNRVGGNGVLVSCRHPHFARSGRAEDFQGGAPYWRRSDSENWTMLALASIVAAVVRSSR